MIGKKYMPDINEKQEGNISFALGPLRNWNHKPIFLQRKETQVNKINLKLAWISSILES